MIKSFADRETEKVYHGISVKKYQAVAKIARRKLDMIHAAAQIEDLRVPPGNRLEKLAGGQHWSIRINQQYRIVFYWSKGNADKVALSKHYE